MTMLSTVAPFLEVRDLRVERGGVEVVHGVTLRVFSGTIATIVGPNGAGKTSTMLAIARLIPPRGRVYLGGRRMDRLGSERVVRWGMVYVPQNRGLISGLTVRENLELGAWTRRDQYAIKNDIAALLDRFPDLTGKVDVKAADLSAAEQLFLAVGRALMSKPRVLLLDEPSTGLPPERVAEIFAQIARLNSEGLPILLAEQYERKALAISDSLYVMDRGRIVGEGVSRSMAHDPLVARAHIGSDPP